MSQGDTEDPEGHGKADSSGDQIVSGDPEGCGGARVTEDQGGAGGRGNPTEPEGRGSPAAELVD